MPSRHRHLLPSLIFFGLALLAPAQAADTLNTAAGPVRVEALNSGLQSPWGLAFLPDGRMLVTEHGGRLLRLHADGSTDTAIAGLPRMRTQGQGGLMGIALHPSFAQNQLIYLSHAARGEGGWGTEVIRARLDGDRVEDVETIFRALPKASGGRHFGGRVLFDNQGYLYISLGDRGERPSAQDKGDHRGSLIRLNADGSVPADNPFVDTPGARPEIFTIGNRNMQGMALNPDSGEVWTHEHGPQGGDEVNIMRAGVNYGWPVITYGRNYGVGTKIGEGTSKAGMAQPLHKWVPSIAPSGMSFYTGDAFPQWQGDLFVGSLKFGQLVRLVLEGDRVVEEQRLFDGEYGRIRAVVTGPDGYLYLLAENAGAQLLRLVPAR